MRAGKRLLKLVLLQGSILGGLEELAAAHSRLTPPSIPLAGLLEQGACSPPDEQMKASKLESGVEEEERAEDKLHRIFLWKPFEVHLLA